MSEENKKNKSTLDKVVMGAIIGTAIGSAIGVSVAPKKGSETRELAKETANGIWKLGKSLFTRLLKRNKKPSPSMKKIPDEMEILPPKPVDHE